MKWTEDEVGTNAIGTTLRIREPITVTGLEHYSLASQQWVCSATPIYDEKKNLSELSTYLTPSTALNFPTMP